MGRNDGVGMIVRSLELKEYRNYEHLNLQFDEGINILYGEMHREKNVLEAIYLEEPQNHIGKQGQRNHSF